MRLHRIERGLIDQGWDLNGDYLTDRLQLLALAALVELMAADIGRPGQYAVTCPMPQRPPSRVKMRRALRWLAMFLTPMGPLAPSPSRASR